MKEEEKERYIEFYTERLEEYGESSETLGWQKKRQPVRHRIHSEIEDLDRKQILDVGCGFGDFYGYLQSDGYEVDYYGLDLHPEFVDIARDRYPSGHFETLDILESEPPIRPDYVFGCGIFNFELEDMDAYVRDMLKRMVSIAREGVAVDFMTSYVDYENENSYHVAPGRIIDVGKSFTDRIALRHDYMPYEFTVYLYVDDTISDRNVFQEYDDERGQ